MIIIVVENWPPYVKNSGYTPGGVIVSEIDMVGLLPWVMGFLIGVGDGFRQDWRDGFLNRRGCCRDQCCFFFFFGGSCGGFLLVVVDVSFILGCRREFLLVFVLVGFILGCRHCCRHGFLLVVDDVGFILGCRRGFLLVVLAVVVFLRLLMVVGLVVFIMGFGGWHGGGYCDCGGS